MQESQNECPQIAILQPTIKSMQMEQVKSSMWRMELLTTNKAHFMYSSRLTCLHFGEVLFFLFQAFLVKTLPVVLTVFVSFLSLLHNLTLRDSALTQFVVFIKKRFTRKVNWPESLRVPDWWPISIIKSTKWGVT